MSKVRVRTLISLAAVLTAVLAATTAAQAVDGTDEGANAAYGFVARVQIGTLPGQACSGVLVAPQWILTEKSCFATDTQLPATGAPAEATTVTVGRTDLSTAAGRTLPVTWLVPHPDRDVLLARLSTRVADVVPARIATTAPQSGDALRVLGFGRTRTEWVPDRLHGADVTAGTVEAATLAITPGADSAVVCKGDAGGPTVRVAGDGVEVVGLHHASGQLGCDGTTGGSAGVVETRVDDLGSWIASNTPSTCGAIGGVANEGGVGALQPDFSGDCAADIIGQNTAGDLRAFRSSGKLVSGVSVYPGSAVVVGSGWTQTARPRILLGDFNGDGRSDIIGQGSDARLLAWPSTGDFSASGRLFVGTTGVQVGTSFTTTNVPRLLAADVTGDGRTDIIGGRADGSLSVWKSSGNLSADGLLINGGGVAQASLGLTSAAYPRLFTEDVDGDGRADLIAQDTAGKLFAYRSLGDLSAASKLFAPPVQVGGGWTAGSIPRILTGDFDGDGRGDIAAARSDGRLSVWYSTGDLSGIGLLFRPAGADITPGWTVAAYPRLLTGDVDADGRTDIIADSTAGALSAWRSSGDISATGKMFPGPSLPAGGGWTVAGYPRVF
jgi:trypsin/VCBS repeat protein